MESYQEPTPVDTALKLPPAVNTGETAGASMGSRLEKALKVRGVRKVYPLAVELGVNESCISRWRRGCSISTDNAIKLCRALDISLDWLLSGRGNMEQHRQRSVDNSEYALIEKLRKLPDSARLSLLSLLDFVASCP